MPKKMTPNSQAKNKILFLQYPFLKYILALKKYYANKYIIFKF